MTGQDYDLLLKEAKHAVFKHKINITPQELISKSYLELHDRGEVYDFAIFKHLIYKDAKNIKFNKLQELSTANHCENICSQCKETKSGASFRMVFRKKTNFSNQSSICRECETKIFLKHVNKDRDKWNNYLRNRDVKRRSDLSDSYIRKLLWKKYSVEELKKMPQIVDGYRKKLLLKRKTSMRNNVASPCHVTLFRNYLIHDNGNIFKSISGEKVKYFKMPNGTTVVQLEKNGKTFDFSLSELVAKHFLKKCPIYNDGSKEISYIDDNPNNCSASNLKWKRIAKESDVHADKIREYLASIPA